MRRPQWHSPTTRNMFVDPYSALGSQLATLRCWLQPAKPALPAVFILPLCRKDPRSRSSPPQIAGHGSGIKLLFWVSASNPTEGHFQSPLVIIGHGNLGKEVRSHDELAMSTSSKMDVIAPAWCMSSLDPICSTNSLRHSRWLLREASSFKPTFTIHFQLSAS